MEGLGELVGSQSQFRRSSDMKQYSSIDQAMFLCYALLKLGFLALCYALD